MKLGLSIIVSGGPKTQKRYGRKIGDIGSAGRKSSRPAKGGQTMPKRIFDRDAPFQSIRNTAAITGLSMCSIRAGLKAGEIPHVMCGKEYRVNIPLFLQQLETEAMASLKGVKTDA